MNDRPVILWLVVLTAEPEYFLPDKYLSFGLQCDLLKLLPINSNCDIKVFQTEWRHSIRTATCCWGQVLIFSIGYFRMRSMQLEKLHVFGRHNTSCLSFSKVCAIEGHSLLKSVFVYKRRTARFSSNLSVTWVDKKRVRFCQGAAPPTPPPSLSGQNLYRTSHEQDLCKEVVSYS